jgi:hypothetical protein
MAVFRQNIRITRRLTGSFEHSGEASRAYPRIDGRNTQRILISRPKLEASAHDCHRRSRLSNPRRPRRGISTMWREEAEMTWSEAVTALAVLGLIIWLFRF